MKTTTPANRYPFATRTEIKRRIESDFDYAAECARLIERRTRERESGLVADKGASGWMSSERITARRLIIKLESGELDDAEKATLTSLVSRYSRQLARISRNAAMAARPELLDVAALFGVSPPAAAEAQACARVPEPPSPGAAEPPDASGEGSGAGTQAEGATDQGEHGTGDEPELEDKVIGAVRGQPGIRAVELARSLNSSTTTISPILRDLIERKVLKKHGAGRGTGYHVCRSR